MLECLLSEAVDMAASRKKEIKSVLEALPAKEVKEMREGMLSLVVMYQHLVNNDELRRAVLGEIGIPKDVVMPQLRGSEHVHGPVLEYVKHYRASAGRREVFVCKQACREEIRFFREVGRAYNTSLVLYSVHDVGSYRALKQAEAVTRGAEQQKDETEV